MLLIESAYLINQYKFLWNVPPKWHNNPFKNKSCLNSINYSGIGKKELIDILLAHECRFTCCVMDGLIESILSTLILWLGLPDVLGQ